MTTMTTPRRRPRTRRRGDRGVTVLFFAIALTGMLAVAGLVLGGSIGYTAVRNAQTAADAAALGGSGALQKHKQNWVDTRDVPFTAFVCPMGNGHTSDFRLYCVELGAFRISYIGDTFSEFNTPIEEDGNPCGVVTDNIICGEFLGGATAVGGRCVAETPDPHGVAVVKLVE